MTSTPQAMSSPQLALGVALTTQQQLSGFRFEAAPPLFKALDQLLKPSAAASFYVFGQQGTGKSHLLQGVVVEAQRLGMEAIYISGAELVLIPPEQAKDCLMGLESVDVLCIDDLDKLIVDAHWSDAWFHLYNKLMQHGGSLLIAAQTNPRAVICPLDDLRSRLQMANVFQLSPLGEEARGQVLKLEPSKKGYNLMTSWWLTSCLAVSEIWLIC